MSGGAGMEGVGGQGERVVAIARLWLGTPYRHQASLRSVGCDCLGLIRGVWAEVTGTPAAEPGPYAPDWAERAGRERLIEAARAHCGEDLPRSEALPGDILVFRWRSGCAAKHAGILSAPGRFIHAYEQAGVVDSPLTPAWSRRVAAVFRFPPAA
ncbi:NlpC/P60 family putative phage cell wall peptidase [Hoeflea marina]|uniref:NlpC/P60 family putative phage cell wall peptidase n=1 Tax=Hoeflea marina TaxID=274592 RepID=A0A317PPK5_9HYPH|nr:NlpC/P60 family protein [Hoeflea marina]PWW02221.1 NlpC/P60 family putative phage cell wall peptidase [Hoeflea marina]